MVARNRTSKAEHLAVWEIPLDVRALALERRAVTVRRAWQDKTTHSNLTTILKVDLLQLWVSREVDVRAQLQTVLLGMVLACRRHRVISLLSEPGTLDLLARVSMVSVDLALSSKASSHSSRVRLRRRSSSIHRLRMGAMVLVHMGSTVATALVVDGARSMEELIKVLCLLAAQWGPFGLRRVFPFSQLSTSLRHFRSRT